MSSHWGRGLRAFFVVGLLLLAGWGPGDARAGTSIVAPQARAPQVHALTLEDRVAAQRAIEEVYWRYRIWPKENSGPKPPLSEVMPDDVIRAKVEDTLRKSKALEQWWKRPVTAAQLQAELDRMARDTRDPAMLRELQAALGNDAFLIAETLGRSTLVDRLIRNWYAFDARFHGEVRQKAERALAGARDVGAMESIGGEYVARRFVRQGESSGDPGEQPRDGVIELEAAEWDGWRTELARAFGNSRGVVPIQELSTLQEGTDRFYATAVLSLGVDEAVVATVAWPKRSFDTWWSKSRASTSAEVGIPAAAYTLAASSADPCTNDSWESRFYVPTGRTASTAIWTGSEMIVWGGVDGSGSVFLNTGGRYDPATDNWRSTSVGANVPMGRLGQTAVWTGVEMIVWGGARSGSLLDTGGRYNPYTDSWTSTSTIGGSQPSARIFHSAVWTGAEMIVWGGGSVSDPTDTGGRYNPSTDSWLATSTGVNLPSARLHHTAVWTGTEMIVWGGGASLNSGGRYNPSTDSWATTSTGTDVPLGRLDHTAVWTGAAMVVWGGGASLNTGGRYDPTTDGWTPTSTGANASLGRRDHTAVWTGMEMIVWGGVGANNSMTSDGGRYNPSTDSWAATDLKSNAPSYRHSHSAVWTGSEMVVWGGDGGGTSPLHTGGRYHPATDSWVPTSTGAGVPSAREGHSAVWTGTEMIVWGGIGILPESTGGRYIPSSDNWIATAADASMPSPRFEHTALWTGTEMIVWGGSNGANLNTGGRYNPSTNSWAATSTGASVLSPRRWHTAVWTGAAMIVWGGLTTVPTNSGGLYDPSTDTWSALGTSGVVPSARSLHTAVWTGAEMIIWGGTGGGTVGTGGRYNPAAGTWSATSTVAAVPSSRYRHTAVWTGEEMIVWGGASNSDEPLTSGGRYSPETNSWRATSSAPDVPAGRVLHAAVWTGTELVVWGGTANRYIYPSVNMDTGGRYHPLTDVWIATSMSGEIPSARTGPTAVWTGTRMIIWGGWPNDSNLHLYCAKDCSAAVDLDSDTIGDSCDNCPAVANVDQADFDDDRTGDLCESGADLADVNRSSRVDGFDLARLARAFGSCDGAAGYDPNVDLDRSGCVDGLDLAILADFFGQSAGS